MGQYVARPLISSTMKERIDGTQHHMLGANNVARPWTTVLAKMADMSITGSNKVVVDIQAISN